MGQQTFKISLITSSQQLTVVYMHNSHFSRSNPVGIYLLKFTIETLEQGVTCAQS